MFSRRGELDEDGECEDNDYDEEPLSRKQEMNDVRRKAPVPTQSRTPKRPDKPLYVPRAARQRLSLQNSPGSTANKDLQSSAQCPPDSCSCPETAEPQIQPSCAEVVEKKVNNGANSSGSCFQGETQTLDLSLNESEAVVWDGYPECFAGMSLAADKSEELTCLSDNVQIEDTDMDDVAEQVSYRDLSLDVPSWCLS